MCLVSVGLLKELLGFVYWSKLIVVFIKIQE